MNEAVVWELDTFILHFSAKETPERHKTASTERAHHIEIPLPRDKEPLRFGSTRHVRARQCSFCRARKHGIDFARQSNEDFLARQPRAIDTRLKHEPSSLARTLESWVRIPLKARMSVCVYSVCVVLCVVSDIATGWSPVQGVLPSVYMIKKLKKRPRPNKMVVEPLMNKWMKEINRLE